MGLYLCIFNNDEEVDGVEIGSYDDFGHFRDTIRDQLEGGDQGDRFPVLMLHSDCDGAWSVEESIELEKELMEITEAFKMLPPIQFNSEWQDQASQTFCITPKSLYDCFFDVDGELLIERLIYLARTSQYCQCPILFQ